jgi:hypothetical protein
VSFDIEEVSRGLLIRCHGEQSKAGILLGVAAGLCFAVFAFRSAWKWGGLLLGGCAIWSSLREWNRKIEVEVTATEKGVEVAGYFGRDYQPIRWLLWEDLFRFEDGRGTDGEDGYSPSGVWAVGPKVKTCILPGLDETESDTVIRKIYERFSNAPMAVDPGYQSIFRDEIISLGLGH